MYENDASCTMNHRSCVLDHCGVKVWTVVAKPCASMICHDMNHDKVRAGPLCEPDACWLFHLGTCPCHQGFGFHIDRRQ